MATTIPSNPPISGKTSLVIPFPEPGLWLDEGQSLDLGSVQSGFCSGSFYKTLDKLAIYRRDIAPKLAKKVVYDVEDDDFTKVMLAKGKRSPVRANRPSKTATRATANTSPTTLEC